MHTSTADEPTTKLLYHYTDRRGLLGILESKTIWATNLLYLNDTQEFRHAVDLTRSLINSLRRKVSGGEADFLKSIDNYLENPPEFIPVSIFVCSFSSEPDVLSQWRAYCPGGDGFSIGFDRLDLQRLAVEQGFVLTTCVYTSDEQMILLQDLLNSALQAVRTTPSAIVNGMSREFYFAGSFYIDLLQLAARLKSPAFSEEREVRLISKPIGGTDPRLRFREGRRVITPYIEFKLGGDIPMPITNIVVGPSLYQELSRHALWSLMPLKGFDECSLERSTVPYRSW